ncbi:MAG: phosphoglucomutase/phosphomannomutase alpha/beta/alpha domain [Planctomycetaceae bacterium]|nr:phosphoglucomutase/phosphomannomutase alpha/beta/alpha domain [Planctomycetaceae bacterium]
MDHEGNHTHDPHFFLQALEDALANEKISAACQQNALRWLTQPEYSAFQPAIIAAIRRAAWNELEAAFWEIIPFGTGGRRGPMGEFGTALINSRTIAESAQGLAVYTRAAIGKDCPRAVIAYDTRLRSDEFARLTATTLVANGWEVLLFDGPRATPELSYAVRHLGCDVGVVISASHNPPTDNGFKAYWSHGGQILPPHDTSIIQAVLAVTEIPVADYRQAIHDGHLRLIGNELDLAYIQTLTDLSLSMQRGIHILFTPLHGTGETNVARVLVDAGFQNLEILASQRTPDGNFSNVPDHLPNPERAQVFSAAIAAADASIDLIFASDPDADRLGVAARRKDGHFEILNGNQVAALLTDYVLAKRGSMRQLTPEHYVLETFVTTPMVARIAWAHHIRVIDDLPVGFKYIGESIDALGPEKFVFACEESLGYLAGTYARDKDAAIAALYVAELAAELKTQKRTLPEYLDQLYVEHGMHLESLHTETCPGARGQEQIASIMQRLRDAPPAQFGSLRITRVCDFKLHQTREFPENIVEPGPDSPSGDMIRLVGEVHGFEMDVTIRPSGTEPKLKFYFAAFGPCPGPKYLMKLKVAARKHLTDFQTDLVAWLKDTQNG